jgi:hypothetical protein
MPLKYILIVTAIVSSILTNGQTKDSLRVMGKIITESTQEPIQGAHVYILGKNIVTTTDSKGMFQATLFSPNEEVSIKITHISFQEVMLVMPIQLIKQSIEVKMIEKVIQLDEVVVKNKNPQKEAAAYINEVVKKYNQNAPRYSHVAQSYYWEKAEQNGEVMMFRDGIGFSIYKKLLPNWSPLTNYDFYYQNSRVATPSQSWKDWAGEKSSLPGGFITLKAFRFFETNSFLEKGNLKKFKFTFVNQHTENGRIVQVVAFSGPRLKGEIFVFDDNLEIHSIRFEGHGIWNLAKQQRDSGITTVTFNYFDGKPFLSTCHIKLMNGKWMYENKLEIWVQKFDDPNLTEQEYKVLVERINPPVTYHPKIWKNLPPDKTYDLNPIRKYLEGEASLEDQFHSNAPGGVEASRFQEVFLKISRLF